MKAEKILIGIDLGSSSLKALALGADSGQVLALSRLPLQHERLPAGGCELPAMVIHTALTHVLRDVVQQLGNQIERVCAIACTGHGAGLYALDHTGALTGGRAVASTDQRAEAHARTLMHSHGKQLQAQVGCQPWPGQPTMIAAHLLGPHAVQQGAIHHLLFAKDYVGFLLTGQIATDTSDASTAGLLTTDTGTWSPLAFELSGLKGLGPQALGSLLPSGTVLGTVTHQAASLYGLPKNTPVAMGSIDLLASMTAIRAQERGHAVVVLGTWCVNAAIGPVMNHPLDIVAIAHCGQHDKRLYMENSPSSMANVAWLTRTLGLADVRATIDLAMSAPLGARGLRFLPFVNGGTGITAGFVGLKSHHTQSDMARAVVDAVAALHVRHIHRLSACGLATHPLTVLGGGASDSRLVRLLASFLGHAVERCADDETGARGAAIYAAQSQAMPTSALHAPCDTVEPDTDMAQACADFQASFNDLIDTIAPVSTYLLDAHFSPQKNRDPKPSATSEEKKVSP